jgi:hypothetical protein
MSKYLVVVLHSGQDVIGEFVVEPAPEDKIVYLKEPHLVGFNPEKKEIAFVDFLPHAESESKQRVPVSLGGVLTWYSPKKSLIDVYVNMKARKAGIVLPNQPAGGLIVP